MVRLAVPASAPPLSAVSRKLRRVTVLCFDDRMVFSSLGMRCSLLRQPEIAMDDLGLGLQLMGGTVVDDGALLHEEHTRTQLQRGLDVLLDQQDRHAGLVDAVDLPPDL